MTHVICGGEAKTYAFPRTVTTVCEEAFGMHGHSGNLVSVRFNEGLEVLKDSCFRRSNIRQLVLSSSVTSIGANAFCEC